VASRNHQGPLAVVLADCAVVPVAEFFATYERLAEAGGAEYRRVLMEWIEDGQPADLDEFICRRAGSNRVIGYFFKSSNEPLRYVGTPDGPALYAKDEAVEEAARLNAEIVNCAGEEAFNSIGEQVWHYQVMPLSQLHARATLTDDQIERQDYVDQAIYNLLGEVAGKEIEWDMALIGAVRDCIGDEFEARGIVAWKDFYPSPT